MLLQIFFLLPPFLVLFLSFPAFAWKIGVVIGAKEVSVERAGVQRPAGTGFELQTGDILSTSKKSRAVLIENSSRLIVAADSRLVIEPAPEASKVTLKIDTGAARVVIDKETAPKYNYKVRTAVAGVRGTEFFLSSSASTANICVLEGEVAATMNNGDLVDVPQGLGVAAEPATRPLFAPTPLETVGAWRASTSEEETPAPAFPSAYGLSAPEHTYGNLSNSNWLDVNDCKNTTSDVECQRLHSYHRFLWTLPSGVFLQATPLLQWNVSRPAAVMDGDPFSARESDLQLRPYELIVQKNLGTSRFLEGGVKPLTWNQPLFIGARRFSAEPPSNPFVEYRQGRVVAQAAFSVTDRRPLDGLPSYGLARVAYDLPWGSSNLGVVAIEDRSLPTAGYRFTSPQFAWSVRFGDTTLAFAAIHESGERRSLAGNTSLSESLGDAAIEHVFAAGGVWRAKARIVRASRAYVAPQIDSYALGLANLVPLADLEQRRLLLAYSIALGEDARLELGGESLESYVTSTGDHQASEANAWLGFSKGAGFFRLHSYTLRQPALETRGWMLLASLAY